MKEIIPAIVAADRDDFFMKIKKVGAAAATIHIDVMDGVFVPERAWADPEAIAAMHMPYQIEAHFMVTDPVAAARVWIAAGAAQRIIPHAEALGWHEAWTLGQRAGVEVGVAVNPDTAIAEIADAIAEISVVLVMGVHPGRSGQPLEPHIVQKIHALHQRYPALMIEVDGGVHLRTAPALAAAGASRLIAASALFGEKNFSEAFRALVQAASSEDALRGMIQ